MKQRSIIRLSVEPNALLLVVTVVLALVATLQSGCTSSPVATPASTPKPAEAPRQAGTRPATPPIPRLVCPNFGPSIAPPALQAKAGHRVILSWKASAPADSKHDAAVGYCVYRGIKPKDPSPGLVNSIPFPGTSCMDDLVENGKKYYYVVRAISAKGATSVISNKAPAAIPAGNKSNPAASGVSAPLCREPASVK